MRQLIITDHERIEFVRRINEITLDGKRKFVAEFKPFRNQRSIKSNNLYWMWLDCIHDETGNDVDDLHAYFKDKYLPPQTKEVLGKTVNLTPSTTRLDSKQFFEYMEKIKLEMSQEHQIFLPEPGEAGYDQFRTQYERK